MFAEAGLKSKLMKFVIIGGAKNCALNKLEACYPTI